MHATCRRAEPAWGSKSRVKPEHGTLHSESRRRQMHLPPSLFSFDLRTALEIFAVVFVAELPDKTALAALVLATRHKPWPVLLGTCAALTVQSLVAVAAGQLVSLLPGRVVHVVAGVVFLASAVAMWLRKQDGGDADG